MIVGEAGWIVPPRQPQRIADAILDAHRESSGSPKQWQTRRSAARARIVGNFSLERMIDAYRELWLRFANSA
jgi:glycosyltransferase involved in cell wall biosynthesis